MISSLRLRLTVTVLSNDVRGDFMNKALIGKILNALAIILFGVMTAVVGYNYASMECSIAHQGASAPAYLALFSGIPFLILIALCLIISRVLKEKK